MKLKKISKKDKSKMLLADLLVTYFFLPSILIKLVVTSQSSVLEAHLTPVLQLFPEGQYTNVISQMEFSRSVEVDYRHESSRMSVEEVFTTLHVIVVAQV